MEQSSIEPEYPRLQKKIANFSKEVGYDSRPILTYCKYDSIDNLEI
jgi:hypothetical protein